MCQPDIYATTVVLLVEYGHLWFYRKVRPRLPVHERNQEPPAIAVQPSASVES